MNLTRATARRLVNSTAFQKVELTGGFISIPHVISVAKQHSPVSLDETARKKITESRNRVEKILDSGSVYYGINTGFGSFVDTTISRAQIDELQTNLVRSHASGVGEPLEKEVVRAMLLCLVASLSRGLSGVRLVTVEHILEFLNSDILPVIPSIGSVGASGDLAPLAHAILPLLGEGLATLPSGEVISGEDALRILNLPKLALVAKEGLGLINGTHLMCGSAALLCEEFLQLFKASLCATAMSIDASQASHAFLDTRINEARVFEGGQLVARALRRILDGSAIHENRPSSKKVQDPYSIRCIAPVAGATWESYQYVRRCVETELGAVTDNPLVFEGEHGTEIISAGNFHGMPVALPMDVLSISVAHLGGISERRTNLHLSDPDSPMLAVQGGLQSGMMIVQYTQAACCNELQQLASPASVNNISTCCNVEDYNSWGPRSAAKARRAMELARYIVASELLAAAEKMERRRPHKSGAGVEKIYETVRQKVARLSGDRSLAPDIAVLTEMIIENRFDLEL